MNGFHRSPLIALFDVDNTLYPRSSGLGRAMGDGIVQWIREHIDLSKIDQRSLPAAKEVDSSFNHPPDIDAKDELIERLALSYYQKYGLTIVGLVKHQGITREQEQNYLEAVHEPSERLEKFMPHAHEHVNTVKLLEELRRDNISMYLFSNAPAFHVWRVLEHIGVKDQSLFDGLLDYCMMRENCKPQMQSYVMMFEMVKIRHPDAKPADCVFLDDAKVNLKTAKEFGFKTVLVCGEHDDLPQHREAYIDFVVDDVRSTEKMKSIFATLRQ